MKKNRSILLKGAALIFAAALAFSGCKTDVPENNNGTEQNQEEEKKEETKEETKNEDAEKDTDDSNADKTWTVTFDLNGGSGTAPANQSIENDKTAAEPDMTGITGPEDKPNFAGWTTTKDDEDTKFSFTTKVTSDLTLYALWSAENYYTVIFATGEPATTTTAQVKEGDTTSKPATDPRKVGYKLAGWYADATYTTEFDFTSAITAETTVYAKFVKAYKVFKDEPASQTLTIEDNYGGVGFWGHAGYDVKAGDWLILTADVAFEKIGKVNAQIGFTADGSTTYPEIAQYYNNGAWNDVTDTYSAYFIYKFEKDGQISFAKLGFGTVTGSYDKENHAEGTVNNLTEGATVTVENLKFMHIAKEDLSLAFPYYLAKSSVKLALDDGGNYSYSPVAKFTAPEGSTLACSYVRVQAVADYKSHFLNSNLGWEATYPNGAADASVKISKAVTADTDITYIQVGTQTPALNGEDIEFTGLEISNIPALSFYTLD